MILLRVENLGVEFRNSQDNYVSVVSGVSFNLKEGEVLGIVGESGSGKSVTALSILKLLPYPKAKNTFGSIVSYKGQNLLDLDEKSLMKVRGKEIAYIFQEPMSALNPLHTIGDQIIENIKIHSKFNHDKAYVNAIKLLRMVGITKPKERMKAYPHELSGGQRQRVLIAMAICNKPKLLIADEPTTALDVTVQAQVIDLLMSLCKKMNMSMIFISHNLRLIEKIADKICVMKCGKIVEQGTIREIFHNPKHEYTKELLDCVRTTVKEDCIVANNVIEIKNLNVEYPIKRNLWGKIIKTLKAVNNVNLQIFNGECLGVVGESGSGKTTLGMCLANLQKYIGEIRIFGENIKDMDNLLLRKKVQIVFQDPYNSLNPRMNIGQIIGEGLNVHYPLLNETEKQKKIIEAIEAVELEHNIINKYPHEFSGGQRQRIAIARALIVNPEILILDEPTSALDVTIQKQILILLKKIQKENNLTYIFISHDMEAIKSISDRVAVMKDGEIVELETTMNILDNPQNNYTKELINSIL